MKDFHIISFSNYKEADGVLTVFEEGAELPFIPYRVFYIYSVPRQSIRANHASINAQFVLIAIQGSVTVTLYDGKGQEDTFILDNRSEGLYLSPLIWMKTCDFSDDAILMVLSDKKYADCKYISNKSDFIKLVREEK